MKTPFLATLKFYFKPYRRMFLGIFGLALGVSVLESVNIAVFFPVLQSVLDTSSPAPGPLAFLGRVIQSIPIPDPVVSAIVLLMGVTLFKCIGMLARDALVAFASATVQHDLKQRLMQLYTQSSLLFFLEKKQGQLLYNVSTAASRSGVLAQKVPQWVAECLKVLAIGGLFLWTLPWATLGLGVVAFGYHRLTRVLSKRISYHTGKGRVVAGAAQTAFASEFFSGIRQILAFGAQALWVKRFAQQSQKFRDLYTKDAFWLCVPKALLEFSVVFVLFGFLLISHLLYPDWLATSLPLIGMVTLGLLKLLPSLTLMGQLRMEIAGLLGDAELVQTVLSEITPPPAGGHQVVSPLESRIEFEKVGFTYSGRDPLFENLNFSLEKGEVTAVVGPSGSGKTTLALLLLGLLEPTQGQILLDGADLQKFRLDSWRQRIGFVSQDLFVFHDTVAENIRFGRGDCSPEKIQAAAQLANADAFIQELPQGYDTVVGERGMKLSGGQQQRLAIARAVLGDPEVLVFDEATSSLDTESERLIQESIERLSQERTVLVIAHRLSTVRRADKIVVLEHGRVLEQGRHEDLLRAQGRYAQMAEAGEVLGS